MLQFKSYFFLKAINEINKKYCEFHTQLIQLRKKNQSKGKLTFLLLNRRFFKFQRNDFDNYIVCANKILNLPKSKIKYDNKFHCLLQKCYYHLNILNLKLKYYLKINS